MLHYLSLHLEIKLIVLHLDFLYDRLGDIEFGGKLLSEDRLLNSVDLISNMLVDVDQIVPSLKPISANGFLHDCLFALEGDLLIVELPPGLENPIVNKRIVVPAISQSIMDHDGVELVGSLLLVGVRLFQDGLHLDNLLLQDLLLGLSCLTIFRQYSKCSL